MSFRSNPLVIRLRALGRVLGINPLLARALGDKTYEARFDQAFFAHVRPGDCVWGAGANHGLSPERLAAGVGPSGGVVAFEPVPGNYAALAERCGARANVTLRRTALGA